MQAGSQRSPGWADLQPELLLQVAALLGNEDRLSLMHTCERWYAAVAAGPPDLLPAAVLACPPPDIDSLPRRFWQNETTDMERAYASGATDALTLVWQAAQLPSMVWRVRLDGAAQPMTAVAVLAALPPGLRWLELAVTPCAGPLLLALPRFSRLQRLSITGSGADIEWTNGSAAVLAPLRELCLDYRREPFEEADGTVQSTLVDKVPPCVRQALAAATALHTLELRLTWSEEVAALCRSLPALRHLSLHLYCCIQPHGTAAVQLLRELPQLTALSFGTHSCYGSEKDYNYPAMEGWDMFVAVPPLASLAALTELCLAGMVQLPPDFRQLAQLQRLTVIGAFSQDGGSIEWGAAPLTSLAALTRVELHEGDYGMVLPDTALLASAPRLAEVHARHSPSTWRAQLAALRPDLCITF